jgi:hypothetical protein
MMYLYAEGALQRVHKRLYSSVLRCHAGGSEALEAVHLEAAQKGTEAA